MLAVLYPLVIESRVLIPVLPGDHEGGERGRVDGEEDDGEQRPDGRHEAGGEGARAVHVHGCLEQEGPHHPVRAEQRELVVGARARLEEIEGEYQTYRNSTIPSIYFESLA